MHSFIKENVSLIAALALPILFAVFFFISKQVTIADAEPPAHDFVLAQDVQYHSNFEIKVIDNRLSVKFIYPKADDQNGIPNIQTPQIYYVSAKTMIAEPIGLELPDDARNPAPGKEGTSVSLTVSRLESAKLSPIKISPDGYELDNNYYYRDGNLMTEIFDARNYNGYAMALRNGSTRHEIKGLEHNASLSIVGWVIP